MQPPQHTMPRPAGKTANIILCVSVLVVAALLWWSISDNYHSGPSYYTMVTPLPYAPTIYVSDTEHIATVQNGLDDIVSSMGPQWGFAIQDTKPDTLHITIHAISGVQDSDSGWLNCLNPEWSGIADYTTGTIHVCVDWWRDDADIEHAILHETIHMMGVGHYFGQGPNIMCSEEQNRSTCANSSGDIRLDDDVYTQIVLQYMYGDDGWQAPNRQHICQKFYTDTLSCAEP